MYGTFMWVERPFDRHDWFVSRAATAEQSEKPSGNGNGARDKARYVIDFYKGPENMPGISQVCVDARPDFSNWRSVWDRIRGLAL